MVRSSLHGPSALRSRGRRAFSIGQGAWVAVALALLVSCADEESRSASSDVAGAAGTQSSHDAVEPALTYHENIEPILQEHCATCHHFGGPAVISFDEFTFVKAYAANIVEAVASRTMPPWAQDDTSDCQTAQRFRHDRRLAQSDIEMIAAWHAGGDLEGDPNSAPPRPDFSPQSLAGHTNVLTPRSDFLVKAGHDDDYRCFVLDPALDEDSWIDGLQVIPGDARVVHSVAVFSDPNRASLSLDEGDGSYDCFGGPRVEGALQLAWAPGDSPVELSPHAIKVEKNSLLVMRVLYHSHLHTTDVKDRTSLQIRRTAQQPAWEARVFSLGNSTAQAADGSGLQMGPGDQGGVAAFLVPAEHRAHTETQIFTLPENTPSAPVLGIAGHVLLAGTSVRISVERKQAGGENPIHECLLDTPRYDLNWQRTYWFEGAVDVLPTMRAGDRVRIECSYDNTMSNERVASWLEAQHRNTTVDLPLGDQPQNEMCLGSFVVLVPPGSEYFKKKQ